MVILFLVTGCYPGKIESPADLDTIATDHDPAFDFKNKSTYYLPSRVFPLSADTTRPTTSTIDPQLENFILTKVSANLNARGFLRIDTITSGKEPDFIVLASYAAQNISGTTFVPSYGGYGGYWGSYYGWGSGWGYSMPYYYPVSYSYNTGTLVLEILDPNNSNQTTKQIPLTWRAVFNGLLTDNVDFQNRLDKNIHQAFIQSPYIGR